LFSAARRAEVSEAHFVSENLTSDHDLDSFDAGQPALDARPSTPRARAGRRDAAPTPSIRIVVATEIVVARFVVVDAIDDNAACFENHYGYQPIPATRRLVRKISDVAHDLGSS
jgi:hypothetical protein